MLSLILAIFLLVVSLSGFAAEKFLFNFFDSYSEIPSENEIGYRLYNRYWGWSKQVCNSIITIITAYQLIVSFESGKSSVWNHVVFAVFLIVLHFLSMQPVSQNRIMKTFWTIACAAVVIYAFINCSEEYCFASLLVIPLSFLSFVCHVKFVYFNTFKIVSAAPTAEYTCDLFSYISFAYLNPILLEPAYKKVSVEFEDVPTLQDTDSAEHTWSVFRDLMNQQTNNGTEKEKLNLALCIFQLIRREWIFQGLFHFVQSCAKFSTPLALQRILLYVSDAPQSDAVLPVSIHVAVMMLFISPFIESFGENQNERIAGHIDVRIKAAMISAVYSKSLSVDLYGCKETTGKINNLMSIDVDYLQAFFSQSHYLWSTPLEVVIAASLLFMLLGNAAWGGIAIMIASVLFALEFEQKLELYQGEMLKYNDQRLNTVGEVLNNIRIIKYSCWEKKFMRKISDIRKEQLKSVKSYAIAYAMLIANWEIIPTLVAASAFTIYCYVLDKPLFASTGFAAMTVFNCLRFPLSQFPYIAGAYIQAKISLKRFQNFLQNEDIKGLPAVDSKIESCKPISPKGAGAASTVGDSISNVGSVQMMKLSLGYPTSRKPGPEEDDSDQEEDSKESTWQSVSNTCGSVWSSCCSADSRASSVTLAPQKSSVPPSSLSEMVREKSVNKPPNSPEREYFGSSQSGFSQHSYTVISTSETPLPPAGKTSTSAAVKKEEEAEDLEFDGAWILENLNLEVAPRSLNVLVGVTGAGKSTLLQGGLLGECKHICGETAMTGTVSYVSQSAWIQHATLRDNVLFGLPYEKERYDKVLFACSLESDLLLLSKGDMTEIGERGVNLSGGQQQRVSLARAAYAKSDVILLDDPLSAVDSHVGEHIFRELIQGFLSDRTCILVTHNIALAVPAADKVICMDYNSGSIFAQCRPNHLPYAIRTFHQESGEKLGMFYSRLIEIVEHSVTTIKEDEEDLEEGGDSPNEVVRVEVTVSPRSHQRKKSEDRSRVHRKRTESAHDPQHARRTRLDSQSSLHSLSPSATVTFSPGGDSTGYHRRGRSRSGSFDHDMPGPKHGSVAVSAALRELAGDQVEIETKAVGEIGFDVYWNYIKACGGVVAAVGLVGGSVGTSMAWLLQNFCLGLWMRSMQLKAEEDLSSGASDQSNVISPTFIHYASSSLIVVSLILFKVVWSVQCTTKAAQSIHDRLMYSVMLAPCSWFDATPIGRIVNRFSKDISTVDSRIMIHLMYVCDNIVELCQILGVIIICLPALLIPFVPIIIFALIVGARFLHVSRELKRLESLKKSPVFVLFSESLQGLSIIRSFRQENRFLKLCSARLDDLNRCHLYLWLCNRWLSFRIQLLGAIVTGCVGITVVLYAKTLGSTIAGIVLIYSLAFCENIMWLAYAHAECQMDMNSADRIEEYSTLAPEKYLADLTLSDKDDTDDNTSDETTTVMSSYQNGSDSNGFIGSVDIESGLNQPSTNKRGGYFEMATLALKKEQQLSGAHSSVTNGKWPSAGNVAFEHIYMAYKANAVPVLRDVSFAIPGKMKVGIVGRTGAGKSSLIAALFRIVEPYSGRLLIDGVNTLDLPLQQVRSSIAIVPQEPTLFCASVRFNLDPFEQHTDDEIWAALKSVHLDEHIASMESTASGTGEADDATTKPVSADTGSCGSSSDRGNLREKMVLEKASNFSVGQRQLLCLARAMLRKSTVLVLDECTASVDHETDTQIQETVRSQLADSTVICIAHRLHTIAYYDLVIVMDKGAVAEFDDPFVLMSRTTSIFHEMCTASGDYNELYLTAKKAHDERQEKLKLI